MKKLIDGEIYTKVYKNNSNIQNAVVQQLYNNIGVIAPEHIETTLLELKNKSRNSYYAFLNEAIGLYEGRGLLRLFNLSFSTSIAQSKIPSAMVYFPGVGRNRVKENEYGENSGKDRVLYVNMLRIGHWSADEKEYLGVPPLTDLYTCLESGVIGYKLSVEGAGEKLFNDKTVLEYLTKIYTFLFSLAMQRAKTTYGGSEFQNDSANFIIAKFFLLNVLGKTSSDTVNDYAYLAVQNKSNIESLKSFEEISQIDYTTLSSFLKTFGEAFYNGEGILLSDFETKWVTLFGDSTGLAVEYVPYLLHFLFAVLHGATLGGSLRLRNQQDNLKKLGLPKLYNAVVSVLK